MYFRIGGTYADRIIFSQSENVGLGESDITFLGKLQQFQTLSNKTLMFLASDYLKVHQFTQNAGVRLIFDLNSLLRNEDGSWNSENAEEMIKFSSDNGLELDWELGNGRYAYLLVRVICNLKNFLRFRRIMLII